jgi:tetratricopeptide (TPR) repeat protein
MAKTKEAATQSPLEEYRQAVAANPKSADAHANLGWGFYGEDKWDDAVREFNEALRLEPGHIEALYGLALTRKCAGAKIEAVNSFNAAIAQLPTLEDQMRVNVLRRLATGHINQIQLGEWKLSSVLGGES